MAILAITICFVTGISAQHATNHGHGAYVPVTPEAALNKLMFGNHRFVHRQVKPKPTIAQVKRLSTGQHPFAVVFGCADSRVPPELIFDTGLGELFTIRVAGNITDIDGIGSAEYAIAHLDTKLIVVLGHSSCGAVTAAVDHAQEGHITDLVHDIEPALTAVESREFKNKAEKVASAVNANIQYQIKHLLDNSTIISAAVAKGDVKIVGGLYDLSTGRVSFWDGDKQLKASISKKPRTQAKR